MDILVKTKTQRIISILLIITMIINMFSPYTSLGTYVENSQVKYNVLRVSDITKSSSGNYMFYVELAAIGDTYVGSFDMSLSYDTTLFGTARKDTGAKNVSISNIADLNGDYTFQTKNAKNGQIRMTATTTEWYNPVDYGDPSEKYEYEWSLFKVYFYLLDPTQWKLDGSQEITKEMISWTPTESLQTGYKQRAADTEDGDNKNYYTSLDYVVYEGFQASTALVDQIVIINNPTKQNYRNEEALDFTGGKIKIIYDDASEKEIDINDAIESGELLVNSDIAQESTKKAIFTYEGKTAEWEYYTVDSISVSTPPNNIDYEHNDNLNFSGGKITVTYKDRNSQTNTEIIDIQAEISNSTLSVDKTKADYNDKKVTFTYSGKTADLSLNVTDPITKIEITKLPSTVEYINNDTISFAGGEITAITKSGVTTTVATDDPDVTPSITKADISTIPENQRWTVEGSPLQAGNQPITLTYQGKTASYNIVVNDHVSEVTVSNPPTADNKYGTNYSNLDLTGMKVTVNTSGGGTFTVDSNSVDIDFSGYNPNTLATQSFDVSYSGIPASNKVNIKLKNYITGITANIPNTNVDYNTTLAQVLNGATYVKNYADGTSSSSNPITESMVRGYSKNPNKSLFDSSHRYVQNLTVTLSTPEQSIDMIPATDNVSITMTDTITSIAVQTLPTKTIFDYEEPFSALGGKIKVIYASGAERLNISMMDSNVEITELDGSAILTTASAEQLKNGIYEKNVLITYTENSIPYTAQYKIKIQDLIESIAIKDEPTVKFKHADSFKTGDGSLLVKYISGNESTVLMSDPNVSITQSDGSPVNMSPTNYNTNQKFTEELNVEYIEKNTSYSIEITNQITKIEMKTVPKDKYNVNDTLDLTTDGEHYGEILVTRQTGTPEAISLNDSRVEVSGFSSTSENLNLEIKVKFTENEIPKETSYNVEVKDSVKSVKLIGTPKTAYKYNEDLEISGLEIEVEKGSGKTTIPLEMGMVSGYTKTTLGDQKVTITYGGKTTDYTVNVKDYVTGITVNPKVVSGTYNDELSSLITTKNIKYTVQYAKPRTATPVVLDPSMVDGYSKTNKDTQNLTVKYTDTDENSFTNGEEFTADLTITLADPVVSIAMKDLPTTTEYGYGDTINLSGGKIEVTTTSGATVEKSLTDPGVTVTEEDGTEIDLSKITLGEDNTATKTLKVIYEGKPTTFEVTVINKVTKIEMKTVPKDKYNVNDTLDLTTDGEHYGEILVTRQTGNPEAISLNDSRVEVSGFSSTVENLNLPITVKFTENGTPAETSYNVEVKDSVKSVKLLGTPKTAYKYDEELDISGLEIEVEKGSGKTTIPLEMGMVSGYDKTFLGDQKVTITYGGKTTDYTVNVKDYVTGITVNPNTVSGTYNDELSSLITTKNIKYTVHYAKPRTLTPVVLDPSMVDGYSKTNKDTQNLTVKYIDTDENSFTNGEEFTADLTINLADPVVSIAMKALPTTTEYGHGDTIDLSGGKIEVTTTSGATVEKSLTDPGVTVTEEDGTEIDLSKVTFGDDNIATKTLKVIYEGKPTTFEVTVINKVTKIEMKTVPKDKYNVNDTLDLTTDGEHYGEILVTRQTGTPEAISLNDSRVEVSGFSSTVENLNLEITVEFTENGITEDTSYNVEVKDSVKSVTLKGTPKTDYKYDEDLEISDLSIEIEKGSGKTTIPVTTNMISGYDKTVLGDQTVTVSYGGKTAKYTVNVKDYVTGITVNPNSVSGIYNTELSDLITNKNIKYTVQYAKPRTATPVVLDPSMVDGYSKTNKDTQSLTVKYTDTDENSFTNGEEFTADLTITLADPVVSIAMKDLPTTTEYGHGDTINLSGGKIEATTTSGSTVEISLTDPGVTVTEEDGTEIDLSKVTFGDDNTATKTLKVIYEGKPTTFEVTVINKVTKIEMKTVPKDKYNVNDTLDLTTDGEHYGEILVTRQTGTPEAISLNDSRVEVSGFSSTVENLNLEITVKFTENGIPKETSYDVEVKDSVKSVTLKGTPKTAYKYDEDLEISDLSIEIEKGSGKTTIPVTTNMISGYDKTVLGDQTVTINYGGKTADYTVNVKDYVTGITVNPSSVSGIYNTELSDLITNKNIKYTVQYAKPRTATPVVLDPSMIDGYSKTNKDTQNLTVKYTDTDENSFTNGEEFTADLTINLTDPVANVEITSPPTTTEYGYGDTIDLTGGKIEATTTSGGTVEKSFTDPGVTVTEEDGTEIDLSNVTFGDDNTATKVIKVSYEGKSDTFEVTIINKVTKIKMNTIPKTEYRVNDTLDLTTNGTDYGDILVERQFGEDEVVKLNDSRIQISGFDNTVENLNLEIKVEFTENGITEDTSYEVEVTDNVNSISIEGTPKTEYKYNDDLEIDELSIKIVRDSGEETIPVTSNMVTGYSKTTLGEQEITISYGGQTATYTVNVSDYVVGIIFNRPTKEKYEYGEDLDLEGGSVQKQMASNAPTSPVELTDPDVTLSTFDPTKVGTQSIDVTYAGFTESFAVTVEDNIQSISMKTTPKTEYLYGDELDVSGGEITVERSSGTTDEAITPSMVTGYNPNGLGSQTLTVTLNDKTTTYEITVEDFMKDIEIVAPTKDVYKIGESIDLTGGTVREVMASGTATSPVAITEDMIQGFNTDSEGPKTVTVTYQGKTKTFNITVVDEATDMFIKSNPDKTEYLYGEPLDLTGGMITVGKESGESEDIPMTSEKVNVSGYNPNKLGIQTLTVTYQGMTTEFNVNVTDYISKLQIQKPEKFEYEYGESLDLSGGTVSIIMASGKVEEKVDMTASMVSGFNSKQEGMQTIKVEYKGLTGNFQVKVSDKIKGISLNSEPNKVQYKYGENLDITGATISVIRFSGITIIPVTQDMISGYNPQTSGIQLITVNYEGFKTRFMVNVAEQEVQKPNDDKKEDNNNNSNIQNNNNNNIQNNNTNNRPKRKPIVQKNNNIKPIEPIKEQVKEEPKVEIDNKPIEEVFSVEEEKVTKPEEKQVEDNNNDNKKLAIFIGLIGILLLLLLIFLKRNVKVYVEEDGEFVLGGFDKISKNNPKLNVDKFLDKETYSKKVKIILNDSISEALDGKEIEITHRGNTIKYKVKYKDEPYEIILE